MKTTITMAPPSAAILLLLLLVLHSDPSITATTTCTAFSAPTNSPSFNSASNSALLNRLQTVQAELLISIGRVPGTAMPPSWSASGAKLGFALEVEFTDESCDGYDTNKKEERLLKGDALMGSNLSKVVPLNEPSFVSSGGTQNIVVEEGAYGCQIQGLESRQYALRFFMDFPEGATRNDVELPGERIYFLTSCWLLGDDGDDDGGGGESGVLQRAKRRKESLLASVEKITRELDELQTKSDESNLFQKALALRSSFDLVERRGKLNSQLSELEQTYPLDDAKVVRGPNDVIFAKEGMVAVKRFKGAMGTREQYHWVGTFSFNDFFEDE